MSVETLIKLGRKAQNKINLQKQGKAYYQKKLANKTNSQAQKSSFGKKQSLGNSDNLNESTQEAIHLAADLLLDKDYDPMRHYNSVDAKLQGQPQDLRNIIPGKFHKEFENHMFWKEFKKPMQQQCSNGISRIRLYAGLSIFDCKALDLATVTGRMRFKEEIGFIEEADGTTRFKALCLIPYKEYEGQHDKTKIFLNPALFKVYTTLVHGLAAVKGKGKMVGRPPLDDTWGLKLTGITPGAIASFSGWLI
ncbi:hypothetical protein M422DRAFT_247696 [Sphaerobolus stellatus SS14]|nr:hypothetical protein M422DRAFT_247696 [Sphaerobolus stellatus SS14]